MNPILVLTGLLVLSYLGSFLVSGRALRGVGLASGLEYVVLGFALGPHALGLVGRELFDAFEPLAHVALGWIALLMGLDFGRSIDPAAPRGARESMQPGDSMRPRPRPPGDSIRPRARESARPPAVRSVKVAHLAIGLLNGLGTGAAVAGAVWIFATRVRHMDPNLDLVLLAGGVGAACAETTRHAIRAAIERYGARGPLTTLLYGATQADDLVPFFATSVLFSFAPTQIPLPVPWWGWVGITFGLAVVLGAMTAAHIGGELRVDQTWGVLLGMSVLGIGVAARLGLATITVLFLMGVATAALSRHRHGLRAMVAPIEQPILLPALVLAGAHIDFRAMPGLGWIAAIAVLARVAMKIVLGYPIGARRNSPLVGAGLLSSGALTMTVGLAFALRFPGPIGGSVLAIAGIACVVGEVVGPAMLRRSLRDAGEVDEPAPASAAATRTGAAT